MSLFYPDKIKSSNPSAYGIVDSKEVSGAKNVSTKSDLYSLSPAILSTDGSGANAEGQLWYVLDEHKFYYLKSFSDRTTAAGWEELGVGSEVVDAYKNAVSQSVFGNSAIIDIVDGTDVEVAHVFDRVTDFNMDDAVLPSTMDVSFNDMSIDQLKYQVHKLTQKVNILLSTITKLRTVSTGS